MTVSGTSSWFSSGTIDLGEVSYQPSAVPTTSGTYWKTTWQLEDWPRPVAENGVVTAPFSSLSVSVQPNAPAARHVAAAEGEFFLLDQQGRVHAAPAQRPDQWSPLESAATKTVADDFSLDEGIQLLTEEGFVSLDPGPVLLTTLASEPALTPAAHPVRFAPLSRIFVRPGTTYRLRHIFATGARVFDGQPNTGLTLPPFYGDAVDAPRRAHSLGKIVQSYSSLLYGLGELHPQTPGYTPGTQVLFKSTDSGDTWVFQPLPSGTGRWRDLAVNHSYASSERSPVGSQIVIVGDDGIYTTRDDANTWVHIRQNLTTATAGNLPLALPPRTDAPINEPLTLSLNTVVWAKDRFIAAGRTLDGTGSPVYVEGLSKYWFAYPLAGWPADREVDAISSYQNRRILLSKPHDAAPLVASDLPIFADESLGDAPVLSSSSTIVHPVLGTYASTSPLSIHSSSAKVRRYVIESSDGTKWGAFAGNLFPPYNAKAGGNYYLQDEPTRLTITAINEFGRSSPLEIEVDAIRPPLLLPNYAAPVLSIPKTVTVPFGSRLNIPVKQLNKRVPWSGEKTWTYGLPAGASVDFHPSAIVGHALVPGTHSVAILTLGNYGATSWAGLEINIPAPAPRPSDAGSFAGILEGSDTLAGNWTVTLRTDRRFTGQLRLMDRAYSIRGTLSAEPDLPNTYTTTVGIPRKGLPAFEVDLILHAADGRLAVQLRDGEHEAATEGGSVANIPWAKDRLTPRDGDYSAAIRMDSETGPVAVGQGFLRMQITALGKATVRGELANGLKWTAAGSLAADGGLPISASIAGSRSLRGTIAFSDESPTATELGGTLAWRSAVTEKCPAYGASNTLSVTGDVAPATESDYDSFLESRRHDLILRHPDLARFVNASSEVKVAFTTYSFQPYVDRAYGETTPLNLALRFDRGTKLATGSFTIFTGGLNLSVTLRGAPVIDPDTGKAHLVGYFLFHTVDSKTRRSGEVTSVTRPY